MKKFIIKGSIFISPIIFLQVYTMLFYSTPEGDLFRLGYIPDTYDYRSIFKEEFKKKIIFTKISDVNLSTKNKYKVLTIGDSFSEQDNFGYQNYLAEDNLSIIHYDRILHSNATQTLYGILNGELLDKIKVDYIILQTIERYFVKKTKSIDRDKIIFIDSLSQLIIDKKVNLKKGGNKNSLFSDKIFRFPLHNIFYFLDDNAFGLKTYQVKTNNKLFSSKKKNLLFYHGDIEYVETNNNLETISKLNNELNNLSIRLKEKGIKLIVLPSPDKLDFYYDYIVDNKKYAKPLFFEHLEKMPKDYIFVNSKRILSDEMNNKKDIYFYDDTHWSPRASQIIAKELSGIIANK